MIKRTLPLAAMLLAGCASLRVETDPAPALDALAIEALPADWSVPVEGARVDGFASLFTGDPLLAEYLGLSANNLDLAQADARLASAQALLEQSRARRIPFLSARASAGESAFVDELDNSSSNFGAGLSLDWDPDLFGSIRADIRGSEAQALVAAAELARARRTVAAQVAIAYLSAVEADLLLAIAEENFSFIEETARVSRARFEAGATSRADFATSELELENARASLISQRLSAREARRALSVLVGGSGNDELRVGADFPTAQPGALGTPATPRDVLDGRWDVRASRLRVAAAYAGVDGARADALPGARLGLGLDGANGNFFDLFDPAELVASLAGSLSDTLFSAGLEAARVDRALAELDGALARYEQTLRSAAREADGELDGVVTLEQSLAALERATVAAEQALDLEEIRFDLGETILLDVLTVQRRVNAVRSSRIRTRRAYLSSIVRAHLALGPAN